MALSDLPSPARDTQVCIHSCAHRGSATAGVAILAVPRSELIKNALDARGPCTVALLQNASSMQWQ